MMADYASNTPRCNDELFGTKCEYAGRVLLTTSFVKINLAQTRD